MLTLVLLVLLLLVTICMAIRDGRPFFGDPLKVALLILEVVALVALRYYK